MGSYSSALIPETEEFVSVAEKQNEQTDKFNFSELPHAHRRTQQPKISTLAAYIKRGLKVTLMMEEEQNKIQSEDMNLSTLQESPEETSRNGTVLPTAEAQTVASQSFSSLLPKALSAVLNPAVPPGLSSDSRPSRNPEKKNTSNLEVLQTELRDLKEQFEQMKSQHNKEIKLLMNELDEEKRIRLTLQMEIQRMKKHMSK